MVSMDTLRAKYLENVETALEIYDKDRSLTAYKRLNHAITMLANVFLIQRAATSSMCAIELSKMYPGGPPVDYSKSHANVLDAIKDLHMNREMLDTVLLKNELHTEIAAGLDSDKIKDALHAGQVSIDQAQKLMRIVHLEKESENHQDVSITVHEGSMLDAI